MHDEESWVQRAPCSSVARPRHSRDDVSSHTRRNKTRRDVFLMFTEADELTIRDLDFDALVDDDRRAGGHASAPRFKDAAVAVHRRRQSSRVDVGSFVNMEAGSPHRTTWQLTRNRAPISAEPSAETSFSDRSFLEVKKLNGGTATQRRCCVRCSDACDGGDRGARHDRARQ